MGVMIDDDGFDWSFIVEVNWIERLFITDDKVFDFMSDESFVIENCVELLLSDDVLASEITGLLYYK